MCTTRSSYRIQIEKQMQLPMSGQRTFQMIKNPKLAGVNRLYRQVKCKNNKRKSKKATFTMIQSLEYTYHLC